MVSNNSKELETYITEVLHINNSLNEKNNNLRKQIKEAQYNAERQQNISDAIIKTDPLSTISSYYADYCMIVHEIDEYNLRHKNRPALKAAEALAEMRKSANNTIKQLKEYQYKLDFILEVFPELRSYMEEYSDLKQLSKFSSIDEFEDQRDRASDYMSNEEWNSLTVTQRNQLALDRYIERQKSPWQIGRDYELCCAWNLEQKGYTVNRHGIEHGVHDLGRDLIAQKNIDSTTIELLVIQCKCWNRERTIRENVIAQLYGTYFAFQREFNKVNNQGVIYHCIPVIMFPSFSQLSDVAQEFCKLLGVRVMTTPLSDFPRIKCNINGLSKIYHLPFDQQYDRAQIKNKGEFYAWTVKEAEDKGFRRAMKHFIS
jgi:hypothetical protein